MKLSFNAKELLCIAAALGISEVVGIPDGFRDVSPRKMKKEVDAVRESLEAKNVIVSDFDGNSSLNPAYMPIWETVFQCERFIALDAQLLRNGQKGILFYVSGSQVVEAVLENGCYSVRMLSPEEGYQAIVSSADWEENPLVSAFAEGQIRQRLLQKIKNSWSAKSACESLKKEGICEEVAQLLSKAFSFQTNFYSYAFVDMSAGGKLKSLMYIDDAQGALALVNTVEGDEDYVQLLPATQQHLADALAVLAKSTVFGESVVM